MNIFAKTTGLLAIPVLALGLTGCVEQEPSMRLTGSVLYEGTEEDDGSITCEVSVDDPELFATDAEIDLADLTGNVKPEDSEFNHTLTSTGSGQLSPSGGVGRFAFVAHIENRLQESTEVGAQGQGGGSGGYEGLSTDQNDIQVTGINVRFPSELNQYPGGEFAKQLEKKILFSPVIESDGGSFIVPFQLFDPRSVEDLADFHKKVVTADANAVNTFNRYGESGDKWSDLTWDHAAIVPLVAELQVVGKTFAGTKVESNILQYPIDVCFGCSDLAVTPTCAVTN